METDQLIETAFRVASDVLKASLVMTACLAALGVCIGRVRRIWRQNPLPIIVPTTVALTLSLGIITYFFMMICVIDRSKSPVSYIPGYEGTGLIIYGSLPLIGLVFSLAVLLWVVHLRRGRPSRD